jgi:MoxR-like ATPase
VEVDSDMQETATTPSGTDQASALVLEFKGRFDTLATQVETVLRGKRRPVHLALVCLFSEGHLLIEDVPGVGKTSLAKAIAHSVGGTWRRVQFTPDLLPSDVTGVSVWDRAKNDFDFRPGGVFANIVLADEINRASPKTQSALLEAMEERQVTVDSETHVLATPFMVMATQNPIELEGTYPLPEAQLDRFLMRLRIGYPDKDAELAILDAHNEGQLSPEALRPVISPAEVARWADALSAVYVAPELKRYLVELAAASRNHRDLLLGVSPRGVLALQRSARTFAASLGRSYVVPDDIKVLAPAVLEHRVVLSAEAQLRGVAPSSVVAALLDAVAVPVQRTTAT